MLIVPVLWPEAALRGTPTSIVNEEGMERFQWPWYLVSIAILIVLFRRTAAETRPLYLLLLFLFVFLALRELDLEREVMGYRWYAVWRYFGNPEVSQVHQLALLAMSVAFVATGLWVAAKAWPLLRRRDWIDEFGTSGWFFAAGLSVLFASAILDVEYLFVRYFGFGFEFPLRPYTEESLELVGAIILFFATVELLQHKADSS
ncbi:MAG: hypothetical protein QNJ73_09905 [Gammaproteobacteria bacterium]|nr:hypothetical protein [Gammaproteobacteria bacterium]